MTSTEEGSVARELIKNKNVLESDISFGCRLYTKRGQRYGEKAIVNKRPV